MPGVLGVKAETQFVVEDRQSGAFSLVPCGAAAPIYLNKSDFSGVLKVASNLQGDIESVSGRKPEIIHDLDSPRKNIVIVGRLGKNAVLDKLVETQKINVERVKGKLDAFGVQTVLEPLPGVGHALVIFGSNKRGTIYGMYELSRQIGISPWYWWADVPAQKKKNQYVRQGFYSLGEPKIKHRGIFINDEAPALRNWAADTF